SPEEVFAYATDFAQFGHWQGSVVSVHPDGQSPPRTGSKAIVTRRVGPRPVQATEAITGLTPPSTWEVRGSGGIPVTPSARGRVDPSAPGPAHGCPPPWSSKATGSASSSPRLSSAAKRAGNCRKTPHGLRKCLSKRLRPGSEASAIVQPAAEPGNRAGIACAPARPRGLTRRHPASHPRMSARPAVSWPAPPPDSGAVSSSRTRGSHPRGRGTDRPSGRGQQWTSKIGLPRLTLRRKCARSPELLDHSV